jgi:type IV pilus assembly protein PilW
MTAMHKRTQGFSLVEFMIAITIGLFLVSGLVYLIAETSRSRAEIERSSRQIENGRYALDRIAEDLRHAGYFSEAPVSDIPVTSPAPAALPSPCETTTITTGNLGLAFPIVAYAGGASLPTALSACLASQNYKPDTDILVIRRVSTAVATTFAANTLYLQTGRAGTGSVPFTHKIAKGSQVATLDLQRITGGTDPAFTQAVAPVRRYIVRIYFVSTLDDTGAAIPTLKMLELDESGGQPAFKAYSIAEGIEDLRFDFGLDVSPKDGVADNCGTTGMVRFTTCAGGALASVAMEVDYWINVVAVQVYIVARNAESSPNYSDDKVYSLGLAGTSGPHNDQYRRHAYTGFVRLNNVSMPRED